MKYSALQIVKQALRGNKGWTPAWRKAEPKPAYDVIIIGGGGHGLATAYYLASVHGITNVAVIEKGYLGSGNIGRNTTIVRSNYRLTANTQFYEKSMELWRELSHDLNYNVMFSPRGVINLAHSPGQMDAYAERGNQMRLLGLKSELLDRDQVARANPGLDVSGSARFPIEGGLLQPDAGNARHDAVAWGYARGASALGVDIIENTEVTGFLKEGDKIVGVEATRNGAPIEIRSEKTGVAVAGATSKVMATAGITELPIESTVLQAFVSESIKPAIPNVITFGSGHLYVSQSDKGGLVFGGNIDYYNSYAQRGNLPVWEEVTAELIAMYPCFARVRLLRNWGGIMDMSLDGSPIIGPGPLPGMYLDAGWCYGGFKATPASGWCFAHTIANDKAHELNEAFTLERFEDGRSLDEKGAGPTAWYH
ncbi:sarcosine oxidase subunit beta family protein [Ahrensia sp. R2A130]|uniref:sarcosine oxidase subunit beta family protein n=1 Tax=Ahrensia sp. R2A130 TaxID=744979 RepID=UPI0001E083E3|nr:sarcosine oxidase subunit beta family protein [Ahrensia sp. R2A130]EFL89226.1 sarcosine oxidase subunit beta [Ahrensia sp. R2A130]